MDWNWEAHPTYDSERIRIDATLSPAVFYDMRLPRQISDHEISLILSLADFHLDRGLACVGLVRHHHGTGVIAARHRKAFTDWLEVRREALKRNDSAVVVVMPQAIYRAVLRVVYRFRTPPVHTITTPDVLSATDAVRGELMRIEQPITTEIDAFLDGILA
jgi:hypothetical protein